MHAWLKRLWHSARTRDARNQPLPVRLRVESLETRDLLSATALSSVAAQPTLQVKPLVTSPYPYGYTPAQIRHAYNVDQVRFLNGAMTGNGQGQTIAIIAAYDDPTIGADLRTFDRTFGLADPPSFTKVNEYGNRNWFPAVSQDWSMEISLDVEWAHAIAPAAKIILVEASSGWLGDLLTAVNYARHVPQVSVVSMSWGSGEFWSETYYDGYFTTPAGHQGVTFVAASGDSGAPPSWPAVSPNVVAVGGTNLFLGAGGSYGSESGWAYSGGGISPYEPQARGQHSSAWWTTARTSPDVAYDANPNTGFAIYDSMGYGYWTGWLELGGTSAGAPQWAGLIAIADQGRNLYGMGTLDGSSGTLPALYAMPNGDFHQILTGGNAYGERYGYSYSTGRGTPYANLVVNALVQAGSASNFALAGATTHGGLASNLARPHEAGVVLPGDPNGPANQGRNVGNQNSPVNWTVADRNHLTSPLQPRDAASHAPLRHHELSRPIAQANMGLAATLHPNKAASSPLVDPAGLETASPGQDASLQDAWSVSHTNRDWRLPVSQDLHQAALDDTPWAAFVSGAAVAPPQLGVESRSGALDSIAATALIALGLASTADVEDRRRTRP